MKLAKSILAAQQSNNPLGNRLVRRAFRTPEGRVFYQKLLLSVVACLMPGAVFATPQSGQVVAGASTITTPDANTTVITQNTDKSIINWQSFSIGADEFVQFVQPDTYSVSLNQVIGGNPSSILGSLSANGQVYLVNPNGIYFGQGVQVDVSGITASVLGIDNNDFMNGEYVFTKDPNASFATVVNEGVITARNNGYVVLLGDYTQNTGVIQAQMGKIVLASGSKVTMDVSGNNLISVVVNESAVSELAGVDNSGEIYADGGRVIMTAKVASDLVSSAVNNTGLIQANSIVEHDGAIFLTASGGDITNSGTLDASAQAGSNVDGGGVLVYSEENVTLSAGAEINANGDGSGSGGVVRVIAEDRFDFQMGSKISTTGSGHQGGFVEISGHGELSVRGDVETGAGGTLLIDPVILRIRNDNSGAGFSTGGGQTDGSVGKGFIETQLNSNTNVTLIANTDIVSTTGSLGGATFTISATGTGDLSILSGNVVAGTSFGACSLTGVCLPGGSQGLMQNAPAGNISLGNVSVSINGGLTIAAGNSSGNASIGAIDAGGIVSITAGGDININGIISNVSGTLDITAGNDIIIDGAGGIGTAVSLFNNNATLLAGNNITINSDIYMNNNTLTLQGGATTGTIGIRNTGTNRRVRVFTLGLLQITGNNLLVQNTLTGFSGTEFSVVNVGAGTVDVNINGNVNLQAGTFLSSGAGSPVSVDATIVATNNINVTANALAVTAGNVNVTASGGGSPNPVTANASLIAGGNITGNLAAAFNITAANATASAPGATDAAGAEANAVVMAGGDVNVTVVSGNSILTGGNTSATGPGTVSATASSTLQGNNITLNVSANFAANASANVIALTNLDILAGDYTQSALSQTTAGNNVSIQATTGDLTVNGLYSVGGTSLSLMANQSLFLNGELGSSGVPLNVTTTLGAGSDVNINNNIYLGNNSLTITADSDTSGAGDVNTSAVTVSTLSNLTISGANINDSSANISAANLTANATGNIANTNAVTNVANTANFTAGGDIIQSGGSVNAAGNVVYSATNIDATNTSIVAGTGLSIMASGNLLGTVANLTGAGMYVSAGNNLDLTTSTLNIGAGTVTGVLGDTELLSVLGGAGITLPAVTNPNGKFVAGGLLEMGNIVLSGSDSYLWFEADSLTMGTVAAANGSQLLVQYSPFTTTNTIGMEDQASTGQNTNYSNAEHLLGIPATTIALGSSQQTGDMIVGANGPLDVGSRNFIFVNPTGQVTSESNVITTGIVASSGFVAVLEPAIFITPVLRDFDVDVDDEDSLLSGDDENQEGEQGENLNDDQLVDDQTDESGMCTAA